MTKAWPGVVLVLVLLSLIGLAGTLKVDPRPRWKQAQDCVDAGCQWEYWHKPKHDKCWCP